MKIRGLKVAVRRHVLNAVARIDPARYHQEAAYVAALFARLDEVVLDRPDVRVEFRSTVVTDRGRGSAESIWGADFGVTASLVTDSSDIEKGVLGQAKGGSLVALRSREAEFFREQVSKMALATWSTIGLEIPNAAGVVPLVRIVEATSIYGETWAAQSLFSPHEHYERVLRPVASGSEPAVLIWSAVPLDNYLLDSVIGCPHGDRDPEFVRALADSRLLKLHIQVQGGA